MRNNMECDKYKKKATMGILIMLSWIIVLLLKDIMNPIFYKIFIIIYVLISGVIATKYIVGYVNCIINSNRSHKPPFS